MNSILKAGLCAVAALAVSHPSAAGQKPVHAVLMFDASSSNPLVADKAFATRVAGDVLGVLPPLHPRDRITLTTLGEYKAGRNQVREATIDKRFTPEAARGAIGAMTMNFPDAVASRLGGVQGATNIVGSLLQMARRLDCRAEDGHVIVLTDGQETGGSLDLPKGRYFEGCARFSMIGVMAATPEQTQALGDAWMAWCAAAGFARCDWRS